jgi:high-affinity iron transporter
MEDVHSIEVRRSGLPSPSVRFAGAALAIVLTFFHPACDGATGQASVIEGKALYRENGCGTCHGASGHGDGPVAKTLDPRPRDFRDQAAFKNGIDVGAIARTIETGVPQGGRMPQFSHLMERERRSLALYVITLREPRQSQEVDP